LKAHEPGNSVRDVGERMKGGAVSEERSPENEAMLRTSLCQSSSTTLASETNDLRNELQLPRWAAGTA